MESQVLKSAIAVTAPHPSDPGTRFQAGFPDSPGGVVAREEARLQPRLLGRRFSPGTGDHPVGVALRKAMSEMADHAGRGPDKFAALGDPFLCGFLYELEKQGGFLDVLKTPAQHLQYLFTGKPVTLTQRISKAPVKRSPTLSELLPPKAKLRDIHEVHDPAIAKMQARRSAL